MYILFILHARNKDHAINKLRSEIHLFGLCTRQKRCKLDYEASPFTMTFKENVAVFTLWQVVEKTSVSRITSEERNSKLLVCVKVLNQAWDTHCLKLMCVSEKDVQSHVVCFLSLRLDRPSPFQQVTAWRVLLLLQGADGLIC